MPGAGVVSWTRREEVEDLAYQYWNKADFDCVCEAIVEMMLGTPKAAQFVEAAKRDPAEAGMMVRDALLDYAKRVAEAQVPVRVAEEA